VHLGNIKKFDIEIADKYARAYTPGKFIKLK
jgi:hypothetical protein